MKGSTSASSWIARLSPESVLAAGASLTSAKSAASSSPFSGSASVSSSVHNDPAGAVGISVRAVELLDSVRHCSQALHKRSFRTRRLGPHWTRFQWIAYSYKLVAHQNLRETLYASGKSDGKSNKVAPWSRWSLETVGWSMNTRKGSMAKDRRRIKT